MKNIPIVIPSYEPDERLITLCKELEEAKLTDVIIVNDGSGKEYDSIFNKIEKDFKYITLLKHDVNRGKGRALKTAFEYLTKNRNDILGCVTADSDGQHSVKDIERMQKALVENPKCLILGARDFNKDNVPFNSKHGNKITRIAFRFFVGVKITDTQTGLRAIPKDFMKELIDVKGDRFEFETSMIIESRNKYPIKEIEIETIYDSKENHSTHFHGFKDSFKIYKKIFKCFFKYIIASLSSSVIDIVLFHIFASIFKNTGLSIYILLATIIARVISAIYNFLMNHRVVFNSKEKHIKTIWKYALLVIIQMFASAGFVTLFTNITNIHETIVKVVVDLVIFFVNYFIQRTIIFKK